MGVDGMAMTSHGPVASTPKRLTELEQALTAARENTEILEREIVQLYAALEPVLPAGFLQQPDLVDPDEAPGGSMRAREVFSIASRLHKAAQKLSAIREAVEV